MRSVISGTKSLVSSICNGLRMVSAARSFRDKLSLSAYLLANMWHQLSGTHHSSQKEMLVHFKELSLIFRKFSSELTPFQEVYLDRVYDFIPAGIPAMGQTVFDVGANIGEYTIRQALRVGKEGLVFAFEPNPDAYSRLLRNIQINDLSNVVSFPVAVSRASGKVLFNKDPRSTLAGRIVDAGAQADLSSEMISVDAVSLDEIVESRQIRIIDVLKIDVEGSELLVLDGARRHALPITRNIVLEYHSPELRNEVEQILTTEFRFRCLMDRENVLYFESA
jgi:FkbM family methyltransferase